MALGTSTRTVGDLITNVKRQFGDESGVQITDQDIIRWINSGQLEIVSKNSVIEGRFSANSVAGQSEYPLPVEKVLHIQSVHYMGSRVPAIEFPEAERTIFEADPGRVQKGVPNFWYEWANIITFWPAPDASVVNGITIYAINMPTTVTVASDLLSLPDKYYEAISSWVMMKAYELDEEFEQSKNMRVEFNTMLDEKNGEEAVGQHATYPTITFVE